MISSAPSFAASTISWRAFLRIGEHRLHADQILEPEDLAQRVVKLGRSFLEQRAQLVVGKEWTKRDQRIGPAESLEGAGFLSGPTHVTWLEARSPEFQARDTETAALAFDEEVRLQRRAIVMEVAPAFDPDLGPLLPAVVASGQQILEALGEAGLAGAIASDDEGEAGTGAERQGGGGTDAAEAFDADRADVGAGRFGDAAAARTRSLGRRYRRSSCRESRRVLGRLPSRRGL